MSELYTPWQFLPSAEISNPALQTQWKLPSVFTQRPLLQIRPLATHSSRSSKIKCTKHNEYLHALQMFGTWVCACITSTLCSSCSWLESSRTLTDVRPWCVHTFSVCTWLFVTFVIVWGAQVKLNDNSNLPSKKCFPQLVKTYRCTRPLRPAWTPCCTHSDIRCRPWGCTCRSDRGCGRLGTCWWYSV